jgi:hypothetical protein
MSFLVRYLRTKSLPPEEAALCEKQYPTQDQALTFCVILRNMGGEALELVQLIRDREDAVLDGQGLDAAILRQRTHIEQDANPPWI